MYLLDTNACIDVMAGIKSFDDHLARMERVRVYTSSISIAELAYGAERSGRRRSEISKIKLLMRDVPVLHVDSRAAFLYGAIKATLAAQGKLLEDNDLLIASIALSRGLTLVTHDNGFARVPDLTIEDWRR